MFRFVLKLIVEGSSKIVSWFGEIGAHFWFRIWSFDLTRIVARRRKIRVRFWG